MIAFLATVLGLAGVILGISYLEARREVCIEGPFGWSVALLFTKRYSPDSRQGRLAKIVMGSDKVATEYHLLSALQFLVVYLPPLPLVYLYGMLNDIVGPTAFVDILGLVFACWITTVVAEDYLWFMVNPFYGPRRLNKNYVPWILHYTLGLQTSYFLGVGAATAFVAILSIATGHYPVLVLWIYTLAVVVLAIALIHEWAKSMPRKFLPERWWVLFELILLKRCTYIGEDRPPDPIPVWWLVSEAGLAALNRVEGGLIKLDGQ